MNKKSTGESERTRARIKKLTRNDPLRGQVGERDRGASLVQERSEALEHRDVRVGRSGHGGKVAVARRLEKRLGDLGTVGERVNEDINFSSSEGLLEVGGALGDGEPFPCGSGVALVLGDVGGDVGGGVEDLAERSFLLSFDGNETKRKKTSAFLKISKTRKRLKLTASIGRMCANSIREPSESLRFSSNLPRLSEDSKMLRAGT